MEVGQKVYLVPYTYYYHPEMINKIEESQIHSIGKKYFYVGAHGELKFRISDLVQHVVNYSPSWVLYLSMQEILDERESMKLSDEIREVIGKYGKNKLSLQQLRQIKAITEE